MAEPSIIIRKVKPPEAEPSAGAWKIALADLMTAMMAFFLLMWLLAASDEETLSGIAEYFTPDKSAIPLDAGSTSVLGGRSILDTEKLPDSANTVNKGKQEVSTSFVGEPAIVQVETERSIFRLSDNAESLVELRRQVLSKLLENGGLNEILGQIEFVREEQGLRIQIVDRENSPMFALGTSILDDNAKQLLAGIAAVIKNLPNSVVVRGHTDARLFDSSRPDRNNWALSAERAESTRLFLEANGIRPERFARIEGLADTIPRWPEDIYDPRNRRIAILLRYLDDPDEDGTSAR
ncbi:MAG: flagellar motor protein MotB [Alphaproteobacteria bacterium]